MGYKSRNFGKSTQIIEQGIELAIKKAKRKYFDKFYIFDLGDGYYTAEGFDLNNSSIKKYRNVLQADDQKKWEVVE